MLIANVQSLHFKKFSVYLSNPWAGQILKMWGNYHINISSYTSIQ